MKTDQIEVIPDISGILKQGEFPWGIVSNTGIALRDEISEETWLELTERTLNAFQYHGVNFLTARFHAADLLNFGEDKFGERYAQAIDSTRAFLNRSEKTISNCRWIAGRVAPSRRRENLTLAHHEAVAKLEADEQDEFLTLADAEGLSVKELKGKIRERHPGKPRTSKAETTVLIDTSKTAAVTDALQILANHLDNPATKLHPDWIEHLATIRRVHREWRKGQKA